MTESAASKALRYAQRELRVDEVHTEALALLDEYEKSGELVVTWRASKRTIEEEQADIEMRLVSTLRAANPEASEAAISRALKHALQTEDVMRKAREALRYAEHQIDTAEMKQRVAYQKLQIAAARMNELGGYLQYLAMLKTTAS